MSVEERVSIDGNLVSNDTSPSGPEVEGFEEAWEAATEAGEAVRGMPKDEKPLCDELEFLRKLDSWDGDRFELPVLRCPPNESVKPDLGVGF